MWNVCPFGARGVVDDVFGAVVFAQEFGVFIVEPLGMDGGVLLDGGVCRPFEFGEERLSVDRGANVFELVDEEVDFFGVGCRIFVEIIVEYSFVCGRSDFGEEHRVVIGAGGLCLHGVDAVHRVPEFVCECRDVVEGVLVIHEDERIDAVDGARIGAAALVGVG